MKPRPDETLECRHELMHALGRKVESVDLDRHQTIVFGVVRTKHRPQRARTDLMENPKWTKRVWRRRARGFRVQWKIPPGREFILTLNR